MLSLLNSIMLKVVVGIGIVSFFNVLSGMLCEIWNVGENYCDITFKIALTGFAVISFIALIMAGVNLCAM